MNYVPPSFSGGRNVSRGRWRGRCVSFAQPVSGDRRRLGAGAWCFVTWLNHSKASRGQLTAPTSKSFSRLELALCDNGEMSDDEIQSYVTNGPDHFDMDEKFCARMRVAIAAGLESAPDGVVTTPGTKNPRYIPTKRMALSQGDGSL